MLPPRPQRTHFLKGRCPSCGSRFVRSGDTLLRHLVHVSRGTRKRYCSSCRFSWASSAVIFSPFWWSVRALLLSAAGLSVLLWLVAEMRDASRYRQGGPTRISARTVAGKEAAGGEWYARDPYGTYGPAETAGRNALIRAGLTSPGAASAPGLPRKFPQSGYAAGANQGMDLMRMLQLLFQATGRTPRQIAAEIDSTSKEELWRKYGHNFASKEEAVAAYDKFQRSREDILR